MTIDELRRAIQARANGRFELLPPDRDDEPSPGLPAHAVIRLRSSREGAGARTVLIVHLEDADPTPAMRLAAGWRARLGEPESVDLLLLLLAPALGEPARRRFEADENFCRKLVARSVENAKDIPEDNPKNSLDDLLDRSFLARPRTFAITDAPDDPLNLALAQVAKTHPWMGPATQAAWREALLSGRSGGDLTSELHAATPEPT